MIKATFYKKKGTYFGFSVQGHAEYAEPGSDIICAAVSALTINAVNSLESLTSDKILLEENEDGSVKCKVVGNVSPESVLLIRSLQIGLCKIYEEYSSDDDDSYIKVFFREVN